MRVAVDKSRRNDQAARIKDFPCIHRFHCVLIVSDPTDHTVFNGDIRPVSRRAASVDHQSAANNKIFHDVYVEKAFQLLPISVQLIFVSVS